VPQAIRDQKLALSLEGWTRPARASWPGNETLDLTALYDNSDESSNWPWSA